MSHTSEEILLLVRTAGEACYNRQLELLETAQLVSATTSQDNTQLVVHWHALATVDPFPEVSDEAVSELSSLGAIIADANSVEDLRGLRTQLVDWLAALLEEDLSPEALEDRPATTHGLNKRMRDELFLTRGKIRATRDRLRENDDDDYDQDAYVATRNQLLLVHGTYLEQLRLDLVEATHEEVARVEDILHPAILAATGDTFVESLSNLRDFLLDRVLADIAA